MTKLTPSEDIRNIITLLEAQPPIPRKPPSREELVKMQILQSIRRGNVPKWIQWFIKGDDTTEHALIIEKKDIKGNIEYLYDELLSKIIIPIGNYGQNEVKLEVTTIRLIFSKDGNVIDEESDEGESLMFSARYRSEFYREIDKIISDTLGVSVSGFKFSDWMSPAEALDITSENFETVMNEQLKLWGQYLTYPLSDEDYESLIAAARAKP